MEQSSGLTLPDLAAIKTIIEAVSQRGAFKANELAAVGTVYNKLSAFLEAAATNAATAPADNAGRNEQTEDPQ